MARAQMVADAFEEADKVGMEGRHVKAVLEVLAHNEEKPSTPTVREFATQWLSERALLGSRSSGSDKRALAALEAFLESRFDAPIPDVKKQDIQNFIIKECARVSSSTVERYRQSLSIMFNSAIDKELMKHNPTRGMKYPSTAKDDKITREAFSREDIRVLLEKLPSDWASMVLVSLHLGGQRLGDCALLKWSQVDFQHRCIALTTQKTSRGMVVPMTSTLEAHLQKRQKANTSTQYVHQDLAERMLRTGSTQHISLEFSALCEALGVSSRMPMREGERRSFRNKTFHSLRASAVTMLHDAGVPLSMAMLIVGHNNAAIHRVYYRPDTEKIRESLENLDI